MNDFYNGLKKGLPIALGYLTVSFSFGVMATNGGLSILMSTIISATNLTSLGQYAAVKLMFKTASYIEIFLTILLINLRYSLMSISISLKLDNKVKWWQRLIIAYGVTDEIYAVSVLKKDKISFKFMLGLILLPLIGWTLGTLLGGISKDIMSDRLLEAFGISLYAMFIAIMIPDAKKSLPVFITILIASGISCIFYYVPYIKEISLGFKIIITSILAALFSALVFPKKEEKEYGV
ncbi:MAG: AzlC family ABC transporter permease [Acholeplasmatales bacterium]|nr:AzlC family ABC transporter permease [Acholeplasmatales bacterium]